MIRFPARSGNRLRSAQALSLTPLIDVVFILLLFFMLATSYRQWQEIPVVTSLNPLRPMQSGTTENIVLRLSEDRIAWNGEAVTDQALRERLRLAAGHERPAGITVESDRQVPVQKLVAVLDLLRASGIAQISLATGEPAAP